MGGFLSAGISAVSNLFTTPTASDPSPPTDQPPSAPAPAPASHTSSNSSNAFSRPPPRTAADAAIDRLHRHAIATNVSCPVPGCNCPPHKDRTALAKHLRKAHPTASPALLASHGYGICPCCPKGAFCLLPRPNVNGQSTWLNHVQQQKDEAHKQLRVENDTWKGAEGAARATVVGLATDGSLGSSLAITLSTSPPPATDIDTEPPASVSRINSSNTTSATTTTESESDGLDYPIPTFAADANISCLSEIDINKEVRRITRKLRMAELPRQERQVEELIQPVIFGFKTFAEDPESERGGLGLYLADLAGAYIFFRPGTNTTPYTVGQLRRRAATFVTTVSNGTFPALWRAFVAAAPDDSGTAGEHDLVLVGDDDYDSITPPPLSPMPDPGAVLRKTAFLAHHGEWGKAWRCCQPSPAADPHLPSSKKALIGLTPQHVRDPLTAADVADEPGVAPVRIPKKVVDSCARRLPDIRATGTLPEDNRIIKAVAKHGGLSALHKLVNTVCSDRADARARDILAENVRAGLLQKLDPVTGEFLGWRPLGIVGQLRNFVWSCVNAFEKGNFSRHYTGPLPEDEAAWQLRISTAEANVTARQLEHDAAVSSGAPTRATAATDAALAAANASLRIAKRPFKFVTNWCYSAKGTETLTHMVRSWGERSPHRGTISDDIKQMYQWVSRKSGFAFIRKRFPRLIPIYRFFYATSALIWFGGSPVPISLDTTADGMQVARLGDSNSTEFLRSRVGGCQGDGGATNFCVGPYHETCSIIQRDHQDADIACTADDTYLNAECEPLPDGRLPRLFVIYNAKRALAKERDGVESVLRKTKLISPAADLSAAPSDLPGSPNHTAYFQRIECIKVAGTPVGRPTACSRALLDIITARLQPLSYVTAMVDTEVVKDVFLLQLHLVRLVSSRILNHWTRTMPPEQTAAAAAHSDTVHDAAIASITSSHHSPCDRAALAIECARLTTRDGGLGSSAYTATRFAGYADSYHHARPVLLRVFPETAAISTTSPAHPSTTGFASALSHISETLTSVRHRFAALDRDTRTWVDGSVHTAYHPHISAEYSLPDLAAAFEGAQSEIRPRFRQRALSAALNADAWLKANAACHAFDSTNHTALIPRREATRLVSYSQTGSGAFLLRTPDPSLRDSVGDSVSSRTVVQRRLGLYMSCLADVLDERSRRGIHVTQHDRLGDAAINSANSTHRHNAGLQAVYAMLRCASAAAHTIRLGDKGDGTPSSKAESKRRHAWLNDGHIPDIYRVGPPHAIWEFKCYTPFHITAALGHGSQRCGGAASTSDGHLFAFGNTEELLRGQVLGLAARGNPDDRPLDRHTGAGRVDAKGGDYADARGKGTVVTLLATESSGALSHCTIRLIRRLAALVATPEGHDATVYGLSPSSPQSFYRHHLSAISSAIVHADALVVRAQAESYAFMLTLDVRRS